MLLRNNGPRILRGSSEAFVSEPVGEILRRAPLRSEHYTTVSSPVKATDKADPGSFVILVPRGWTSGDRRCFVLRAAYHPRRNLKQAIGAEKTAFRRSWHYSGCRARNETGMCPEAISRAMPHPGALRYDVEANTQQRNCLKTGVRLAGSRTFESCTKLCCAVTGKGWFGMKSPSDDAAPYSSSNKIRVVV